MTYISINTKLPPISHDDISFSYNVKNEHYVSNTLYYYLQDLKREIEKNQKNWDHIKKYVNQHEFIHTKLPGCKYSVCKYTPISRSFFKLTEILHTYDFGLLRDKTHIKSFHLAEAPGGFIEALHYFCKQKNIYVNSVGVSLFDSDDNIPSWNYSFFSQYKNINIDEGVNRCNLNDIYNYKYIVNKYSPTYDFITADGGFDFSSDFNNQESLSHPLILAEVLYAITLQKYGGCFILKIFDCFSRLSCEIIYILSYIYDKVYIFKPSTSRPANSERYLICKNFCISNKIRKNIIDSLMNIFEHDKKYNNILDFDLPLWFTNRIEEMNAILGQNQLETISNTITIISHKAQKDKIDNLKNNNIQKCIGWCIKHNFPYNKH